MPREPGLLTQGQAFATPSVNSLGTPGEARGRSAGSAPRAHSAGPYRSGSVPRQPRLSGLLFTLSRDQSQAGDSAGGDEIRR